MSYKTYTTEAIVCGSTYHNTSDRNYLLFSKESGMLFAHARSVREERSKQRYALQDFSRIRVSLLKGKSGWRIGSVESFGNPFMHARDRATRGYVSFIITQLRRYVQGELPLPRAYEDATALLERMPESKEISAALQDIFLFRLLAELGYVAPHTVWDSILSCESIHDAYEVYTKDMVVPVSEAIQEGQIASHL